jgi:acetyl-CoA acetyltransferase
MARVIEQTGIEKSVIDGLALSSSFSDAANPFQGPMLAGYLGLELNWCQTTDLGGGSCTGSVARAAAAIGAGLCDVALVLAADAESTENGPTHREPSTRKRSLDGGPVGRFRCASDARSGSRCWKLGGVPRTAGARA